MACLKRLAVFILLFLFEAESSGGQSLPQAFKIYWQVPTQLCRTYGLDFSVVGTEGVVQNTGDKFRGDKLIIMYDPGKFPYLNGSLPVDGGIPQGGDLNYHLDIFEKNVTQYLPDRDFDGLAIIDFEHWRPIFRENWASLDKYRNNSKDIVQSQHPKWSYKDIYNEAERRWEDASFAFFKKTLEKARYLRPQAKWGYYGFPHCFNYSPLNPTMECTKDVKEDNNRSPWMWEAGNALFPSVYFGEKNMDEKKRATLIQGRVQEGLRIASKAKLPLYIYTWFKYHDTFNFVSQADMLSNLYVPKKYGANGVIIWGSSKDVDTQQKCQQLYDYFKNVITPALKKINNNK